MDDKLAVGRIYRTTGGARGEGYAWFIYESSRRGFAPTRDQAAAEWKAAYELEKGHAVLLGGPVMAPSESGNEGLPVAGKAENEYTAFPESARGLSAVAPHLNLSSVGLLCND
jgi:hypothetical protein